MNDKEYYADQTKGDGVKFDGGKHVQLNEVSARVIIEELTKRFPEIAKERENELQDARDGGWNDADNERA